MIPSLASMLLAVSLMPKQATVRDVALCHIAGCIEPRHVSAVTGRIYTRCKKHEHVRQSDYMRKAKARHALPGK